ncbi:hypothetical protein CEUSTIGMA_g12525.t1 [Chlamydomonas eustigma]|uniref:CCHC-type domain-containing protein n=1 Tax=Chlamydomonas eustigma TaxID=1157962 RepID=A0A250XPW4_9CHLO|nr:hypothetical protein CEUSTIGMA_g12525.t1 [Chlamydomonas eustigma]|eukprot:GAX85105.1 hypothetical protein CEUSTIGMA_g12525.t1 [Chlamydomonas eustigma]
MGPTLRPVFEKSRKNRYSVEEELPTFIDDHSVHKFVSEFLENLLRTNQPLIDDELIDAVTRFVSGEGFQSVGRSEWAICWYCRKGTHMAKDCPLKKKKDEPK